MTVYCLEPEFKKLTLPANRTECVLLSRDGDKAITLSQRPERILLAGQSTHKLFMWDTATQRVLWSADAPSSSYGGEICWSSDFKSIALVCTGAVRLYNSADGKFRDMKNAETASSCVTFTPDGKRVLAGSEDGTVHVWDSESGEKVFEFQAQEGEVGSLVFTREDGTLYTAGVGGVKFWVSQ